MSLWILSFLLPSFVRLQLPDKMSKLATSAQQRFSEPVGKCVCVGCQKKKNPKEISYLYDHKLQWHEKRKHKYLMLSSQLQPVSDACLGGKIHLECFTSGEHFCSRKSHIQICSFSFCLLAQAQSAANLQRLFSLPPPTIFLCLLFKLLRNSNGEDTGATFKYLCAPHPVC